MLFDVTRGGLADTFGEDRLATLPATAFSSSAADTDGARLLATVGVPAGTFHLREPGREPGGGAGRLPLVRDVVDTEDHEEVAPDAGEWPVIGWLLNAHVALAPGSGTVYAFDADEGTAEELHTDVSSLIRLTARLQRLLEEFTFSGDDGDEEADFERLEREVEVIRAETHAVDPLPFRDDETVWSVIAEEIAAGRRFAGNSPGARALYG